MTLLTTWPSYSDDDGTGQTGTLENAAYFDTMKSAIEALIHSTTNTTTAPKAITDEVITARGSIGTLDGRLDVSLNEDGTPKASAFTAYVATADLQAAQGMRNLILNDDLTDWAAGAAAAPDNWTLSGGGAAVARTGSGEADTFSFLAGKYSAKITYGAATAKLTQTIKSAADFANYTKVQNKTVAFGCWGKSSIASHLSIVLDDGVTTTRGGATGNATYHTGSGSAEWLYGTHTIANTATKIDIYVEVAAAGAAYCGGFGLLFSNKALAYWPQFSTVQLASGTVPGLVSTAAQSFEGIKNFKAPPTFEPGTSSGTATIGGVLSVNTTLVTAPDDTNENTLMSYSLPANTLSADNKVVRVTAFLIGGAVIAGALTLKAKFGSAALQASLSVAVTQRITTFFIVRTGSNAQLLLCRNLDLDITTGQDQTTTGTETDSGAITIAFTLTKSVSTDDFSQSFMMVEVLN